MVNHYILIKKLQNVGIHGTLLLWFFSYLTNRHLTVKLSFITSKTYSVPCGVPQGSLLGPFLFKIFINDIASCFSHSKFALFADDLKVYTSVASKADYDSLQNSLLQLEFWCNKNKMSVNTSKCKVVSFHRSNSYSIFEYKFCNINLPRCETISDLGILLNSKFTFSNHIASIVNKANRTLGFISRSTYNFHSTYPLIFLYKALVRPLLEYGSTIWNPYVKSQISLIESVQRRYLRLIWFREVGTYENTPYDCILEMTGLDNLSHRRYINDITFLYKLLHHQIDCPELLNSLNFHIPSLHTRKCLTFSKKSYPTNYNKYSSIPRLMETINNLPSDFDIYNFTLTDIKRALNQRNNF